MVSSHPGASQVALVVKNPPTNSGDTGNVGLIPGWRRSPGGGHGNPLWYSCLENPLDRGVWWAAVQRVAESQTQLSEHQPQPAVMLGLCPSQSLAHTQLPVMDAVSLIGRGWWARHSWRTGSFPGEPAKGIWC